MQLVMGMSADGYVSINESDDMKWLGKDDKAAFKLLTLGADKHLLVSRKSGLLLPHLEGRKTILLSRDSSEGFSLSEAYTLFKDGVLIGGQTIAVIALQKDMIHRAHICKSVNKAPLYSTPAYTARAQKEEIMQYITKGKLVATTKLGTSTVETWDL